MKKNNVFVFVGLLFISSCNIGNKNAQIGYADIAQIPQVKSKPQVINIDNVEMISDSLFMNDHAEKIKLVQLDNAMPIGAVEKMRVYQGRIYILSDDRLYVFDENTGKYLFVIDYKGHGHNEYLVFRDFQILPQENLIMGVDDTIGKLFFYSLKTGKFIKNIDTEFGTPTVRKMAGLYFLNVLYGTDNNDDEVWQIVAYDGKEYKYKQFKLSPIQKNVFRDNLHEKHNGLIFTPLYSDTIYTINKNLTYSVSYIIKNKNSVWNIKDKDLSYEKFREILKTHGYSYLAGEKFQETKTGALFCMMQGDSKFSEYERTFYYDKQTSITSEIMSFLPEKKLNMVFPTIYCVNLDRVYGIYSELNSIREKIKLSDIANDKLRNLVENSKSGDNPILVSFIIK